MHPHQGVASVPADAGEAGPEGDAQFAARILTATRFDPAILKLANRVTRIQSCR
jgi:hypothetical protein